MKLSKVGVAPDDSFNALDERDEDIEDEYLDKDYSRELSSNKKTYDEDSSDDDDDDSNSEAEYEGDTNMTRSKKDDIVIKKPGRPPPRVRLSADEAFGKERGYKLLKLFRGKSTGRQLKRRLLMYFGWLLVCGFILVVIASNEFVEFSHTSYIHKLTFGSSIYVSIHSLTHATLSL